MQRGQKVWWNGQILPENEVKVSLFTHGLHYGTGVFEGIRVYKSPTNNNEGYVFRLLDHTQRLVESLKILDYTTPYSAEAWAEACQKVATANGFKECYLRPIAFVGDEQLGVFPGMEPKLNCAILAWEWGKYLGDKSALEGARLMVSSWVRPHVNSIMTKGKISGHYVAGSLAKREAKRLGFDEALMLDKDGFVAEGTGENVFIVKKGVIKTTPLTSILAGITRDTLLEHLKYLGLPVSTDRFSREEVYTADEMFLCGTAAEITPIQSVDHRKIGSGKPGELTKQLISDYSKIVRGEMRPPYSEGKGWWSVV